MRIHVAPVPATWRQRPEEVYVQPLEGESGRGGDEGVPLVLLLPLLGLTCLTRVDEPLDFRHHPGEVDLAS